MEQSSMYVVPDAMTLAEIKEITDYMRSVGAASFTHRGLHVKFAADWSAAPTSFGDNAHDDEKRSETYKKALAALQEDEVSEDELMDWSSR